MSFKGLRVGDKVWRRMGRNGPAMHMVVVHVGDKLLFCDAVQGRPMKNKPLTEHWMFDRDTGEEEDRELGWGRQFGKTGTYLEK